MWCSILMHSPFCSIKLSLALSASISSPAFSCDNDILTVYMSLENPDMDLINPAALSDIYCSSVSPGNVISLHHVIVLVFHTRPWTKGAKGFLGRYSFIDAGERHRVICGLGFRVAHFIIQQLVSTLINLPILKFVYSKCPSYGGLWRCISNI